MDIAEAKKILFEDAEKIRCLIKRQTNFLCIAKCKAFEEVIDTQLYGFSCKLDYAIKLGVITNLEGKELITTLEEDLANIYAQAQREDDVNERIEEKA